MSMIPNLDISRVRVDEGSALMNIYASCELDLTGRDFKKSINDFISYEVAIHLYMFGSFMKC